MNTKTLRNAAFHLHRWLGLAIALIVFKNLFDTLYYESYDPRICPGAPFTILGSISVEF